MRNKEHFSNILSFVGLTIMIRQDVKAILESPNVLDFEQIAITILIDANEYNGDDPEIRDGYASILQNKKLLEDVFPSCVGIVR